jgi:hypothetical protein
LTKLQNQYGLKRKFVAYVKTEGSTLNTMTIALNFIKNYEALGLDESFEGNCFGHVFLKTC